jgi:hypothetical protein
MNGKVTKVAKFGFWNHYNIMSKTVLIFLKIFRIRRTSFILTFLDNFNFWTNSCHLLIPPSQTTKLYTPQSQLKSCWWLTTKCADVTICFQIVPITQSGTPDKVTPWATPSLVGGKPWNGEGSYAESSISRSRHFSDEAARTPCWNRLGNLGQIRTSYQIHISY